MRDEVFIYAVTSALCTAWDADPVTFPTPIPRHDEKAKTLSFEYHYVPGESLDHEPCTHQNGTPGKHTLTLRPQKKRGYDLGTSFPVRVILPLHGLEHLIVSVRDSDNMPLFAKEVHLHNP